MDELKRVTLDTTEKYHHFIETVTKKTKVIEYVVLNGDRNPNKDMLVVMKNNGSVETLTSSWAGTRVFGKKSNKKYVVQYSDELKKELLKFENFFIVNKILLEPNTYKCKLEYTSWGLSDIAFYSHTGDLLAFSTTHEGWVFANLNVLSNLRALEIDPAVRYLYGLE